MKKILTLITLLLIAQVSIAQKWYHDHDGDGLGGSEWSKSVKKQPPFSVTNKVDCDDYNPLVGAGFKFFADADGDGYGNKSVSIIACIKPVGYVSDSTDCNDVSSFIHPGAVEIDCNGIDENCDGIPDQSSEKFKYYMDVNKDGFIDDPANYIESCVTPMPAGYTVTAVPAGTIYLTTDTVNVNPWFKSATAQEIGYTGGGANIKERNILSTKFLADIDSFGFNNMIYPAGAQVDNYHVIIGDTIVYQKDGGKGSGYNPVASDFIGNPDGTVDHVNDGALVYPFKKDLWNEYVQLCDTLGMTADITANIQWASDEEILWQIEQANPAVWGAGVEQNLMGNSYRWKSGGKSYMERVNPLAHKIKQQYPNVKLVVDVAPIWRETPYFKTWNNDVAAMITSDWDGIRAYDQIGDLLPSWTLRPEDDLISIMNALDVINPERFRAASQKYGGRKLYIFQYYAPFEGNYPQTYRFTHFGAMYIGLEFEWLFKNATTDKNIAYAAHWNLKQAWDQNENIQPEFLAHILFNQMFTPGRKWLQRTGIPTGLRVYGSVNPATGNYQVAIVNPTNSTIELPYISFDGFVTKSYSGDALQSSLLLEKSKRFVPKQIDPYAVIMLDFTSTSQ